MNGHKYQEGDTVKCVDAHSAFCNRVFIIKKICRCPTMKGGEAFKCKGFQSDCEAFFYEDAITLVSMGAR